MGELKRKRDYFAHHFFREENNKLFSSETMLNLLCKMHALRLEVAEAEQFANEIHANLMRELWPERDFKSEVAKDVTRLKQAYFENPSEFFGWDKK